MRRLLTALCVVLAVPSFAAEGTTDQAPDNLRQKHETKDASLGKKETSAAPDKSLAGDITRKKEEKAAPALQYDQFRLAVELQVRDKRLEQIKELKKIIAISSGAGADAKEMPGLLFRLAELYYEETKYFFFEANRKDDDYINAMNRKDKAAMEQAKREKASLLAESKRHAKLTIDQYEEIVQKYKDYERTDEVLYFLGHNLMEQGDDRRALLAYERLIRRFPKSKFMPDAYLAFGEYYFNNSKGKHDMLEKALEYYKLAAGFPASQVYGFALYKQGWCYFNLADYQKAMDMFKAVILYGEFAGAGALEKDGGKGGKGGKSSLIREARNDFVRAYARFGSPQDARAEFGKVASKPEDRRLMMKQLANLYYEDGKDKEAAVTFHTLIMEQPLSPEAPGFQGKIVDCVLRAGDKKMTVAQVRQLVKITQNVEKAKVARSEKDLKALEEAREMGERTLSNLAVNWHNEAKKTRDEQTFMFANEVYSDYLNLYPDNPKAYDLRFFWAELLNDNLQKYEKAADEYTRVLLMDVDKIEKGTPGKDGKVIKPGKPGKYMTNAAYNAILAYDEVVKKAEESGAIKAETASGDVTKKMKIPEQKKQLLLACERYLKYVPKGDKRVEVAFKAANIYYRYNYFDEAVTRFADIALNHTDYKFENGDRAAEVAAHLILDSYDLLQDWVKVDEWARKFYKNEQLNTGKFHDELSGILERNSFKLVSQLEGKKEFQAAAEAYLRFVEEFPKSDIADQALYNAAIDFFNARMLDKSIETRNRMIEQYPKSKYVPGAIFANAESDEAVGNFEDAAHWYEVYVDGYERSQGMKPAARAPKKAKHGKKDKAAAAEPAKPGAVQAWDEGKAQIALFNAGVFREGLGQQKQALANRELFVRLWPDSKDAEAVTLAIADLESKTGQLFKANKTYEEYEKKNIKDPNKVLMAEGKIAGMYEKSGKMGAANKIYERAYKFYEKLPTGRKKALDPASADAVGHASLLLQEAEFRKYEKMKLRWGRMPNPVPMLKQTLLEKSKAMANIKKNLTATIELHSGDAGVCALYKMGMGFDNMYKTVVDVPPLRGVPPEQMDEIKAQFAQQGEPVKNQAAESFMAAVAKGQELGISNDCSAKALKMLRDTYRPDAFPPLYEEVADVKGAKTMAVGGDVLASVQPIPVVSANQSKKNQDKAKEQADAMKELDKEMHAAPAEKDDNGGDVTPAKGEKGNDQKGSQEPEDNL